MMAENIKMDLTPGMQISTWKSPLAGSSAEEKHKWEKKIDGTVKHENLMEQY